MPTSLLRKPKKNSDKEAIKNVVKKSKKEKKVVLEKEPEEKKLILLKATINKDSNKITFKNLDDLPRVQKEAVKFFDGKKMSDKNKTNLAKAMKAVVPERRDFLSLQFINVCYNRG
jgi:hypothetical protein